MQRLFYDYDYCLSNRTITKVIKINNFDVNKRYMEWAYKKNMCKLKKIILLSQK